MNSEPSPHELSRRRGIDALRALAQDTNQAAREMTIERERFRQMADVEHSPAVVVDQLFQTPAEIAGRMAELMPDCGPLRILEPSAGLGMLFRAIRQRNSAANITLVEIAADCCRELYRQTESDPAARLFQRDFLACCSDTLGGFFDVVVMNPPFRRGTDVKHIRHAVGLLRPGGLLVSLCYDGVAQRRAFQSDPAWTWEPLPANSFKDSGTGAGVVLLTHRKAA